MVKTFNVEYDFDVQHNILNISQANQVDLEFILDVYSTTRIKDLNIYGDYIHTLIIPNGVERVICACCALRVIEIPDSVTELHIYENKLEDLELPSGIEYVNASQNLIQNLVFRDHPTQLKVLELEDNRLQSIDFKVPKTLWKLNISKNIYLKNISKELNDFIDAYDVDF
jgi:Leucine-rich repeat (LRR) protein